MIKIKLVPKRVINVHTFLNCKYLSSRIEIEYINPTVNYTNEELAQLSKCS